MNHCLFPPTCPLYDFRPESSPGFARGRQIFTLLITSKCIPPSLFFLATHSFFMCSVSLISYVQSISLPFFSLCTLSLSTASLSCSIPPNFFSPSNSLSESLQSRDFKGMSPPYFCTQVHHRRALCQGLVPTGNNPAWCGNSPHLIWQSMETVKADTRNHVISCGMQREWWNVF